MSTPDTSLAAPTQATVRRQIEDLTHKVHGHGNLVLVRIPHIKAATGHDSMAERLNNSILEAVVAELPAFTVIGIYQHHRPLTAEPGGVWDATDHFVCSPDQVLERFMRRRLWDIHSPYPVDLGLCDERPTMDDIARHRQAVSMAVRQAYGGTV